MLNFLCAVFTLTLSLIAYAENVAFECPALNLEISKHSVNEKISLLQMKNLDTEEITKFTRIELPNGVDYDSYVERVGMYYDISLKATTTFPYMPEFLMLYHSFRAEKLYKKGFMAMEKNLSKVILSKMYCNALIKALQSY